MRRDYDIIILGAGTTAFAGARLGAARGRRVLMVEQSRIGGTCINWGCIPSKTLIHKAQMYHSARKGRHWGLNLEAGRPECGTLMPLKDRAIETVRQTHYQREIDRTPNITLLQGRARFISDRAIEVEGEIYTAPKFLIATGGRPRIPPLQGLDQVPCLTSHNALLLPCFPESMLILGGGVIALEMGQMLARFGTRVTILEKGPRLLAEFDLRLTELFRTLLETEGVKVISNVEVLSVARVHDSVCLYALINGAEVGFQAERLMLAIGTEPATRHLGLEDLGVTVDNAGFIKVDHQLRTSVPGIWAAGDVTGPPLIAPAGAREAQVAVRNMLDPAGSDGIDHRFSPMAVFVDPEFATVGLTKYQAQAKGYRTVTTFLDLERIPKAHVMGETEGGIILTAEQASGRILGVQMLCPRAADIIHEATMAVQFGITVIDLAQMVHVYPSISDILRQAAQRNAEEQNLI